MTVDGLLPNKLRCFFTRHGFVTVLVGVAVATALVTDLSAFGLRYEMKAIKLAAILAAIVSSSATKPGCPWLRTSCPLACGLKKS